MIPIPQVTMYCSDAYSFVFVGSVWYCQPPLRTVNNHHIVASVAAAVAEPLWGRSDNDGAVVGIQAHMCHQRLQLHGS